MNWLSQHIRVLFATLQRISASPLSSLLNILVIGIALSLPAGLYALLHSVQKLTGQTNSTPQISIFLRMDASKDDVVRIGNDLRRHIAIKEIKFVPRGQALEQIKQVMGLSDVVDSLDQNPLPDAYVIYPRTTDAKTLEALRDELRHWAKTDYVQLDSEWAYKLQAALEFGRLTVLVLAVLLGSALIAVTFNTIRLQILTRRDEIEVAALMGATPVFIRRPFLYFGFIQGLLGAMAAWLIVNGSLLLLDWKLQAVSQLYATPFTLQPLSGSDSMLLLLFSAGLGWLGAGLSVRKHALI